MARWVKTYTPGGYGGLTNATFVVDLDSGAQMGFWKSNNQFYITHNGVVLEGTYATAADAETVVLAFTNAHTFTGLITYS